MRMLVTGGAGFIGSHLVDALLARGDWVVATDNLSLGSLELLEEARKSPRFSFVEAELADPDALPEELEKQDAFDIVWHLAANSDIAAGARDDGVDFRNTFQTTRAALALCRQTGSRRLLFASTSAVHGDNDTLLHEDSGPLLPISNYGAMKLASEAAISAAVETCLDQAWILRFPNVVGSRATHGVIRDLCAKLEADPSRLPVLGDGTQQKPYLHVSELIEAMLFITAEDFGEGRSIYNIGPPDDGVRVSAIVDALVATCGGRATIEYAGGSRGWVGDVPRFRYSTRKLAELGWQPKLGSRDAIERAVEEIAHEWGVACSRS